MDHPTYSRFEPRSLDPRQQDLLRRLGRIGPGPQAFFRDACKLMAARPLDSTTHVVAHLLREVESAIRDALTPFSARAPSNKNRTEQQNHREDILAILKGLGIPDADRDAKYWLSLAGQGKESGLASRAHRNALGPPRPLNKEFEEFWHRFQGILELVLERFEDRYLVVVDALDKMLAMPSPTKDDAANLRGKIPHNYVLTNYFFSRLDTAAWLDPLREAGFFRHPPEPIELDERRVQWPSWPESQYLARMASRAPALVLEIALQIPDTKNSLVYEDLADAALALPAQLSVKLLPKLLGGMNSPYRFLLPEKLGNLVSHLARGGEVEKALGLARDLLPILCGLDTASTVRRAEVSGNRASQPPDDDLWTLDQIIGNDLPPLVEDKGIAVVALLADLLEKALATYRNPYRQAIEKDERIGSDIGNVLISALRDAANACMPAEGQEVLALLAQRPSSVFRRIELHLRRVWPDTDSEGTARLLADAEVLSDTDLWHELFLLLQERFPDLPKPTQEGYLGFVDRGANVDRWREGFELMTGKTPSPEECESFLRRWQYWCLIPIASFLRDEWKDRYDVFRQEFGEPEHPDYDTYSGVRVGPTSPKTAEELVAMSVRGLTDFLASWTPSEDWLSPSRKGLGRELASVVSEQSEHFAKDALLFQGLDPTFVRALIGGLQRAVERGMVFDWELVIELCLWAMSQPREIPGRTVLERDADPDWGWTRKAIVSLLRVGLDVGTAEIPYALRRQVWRVIEPLTEDPDPTAELEARYDDTNLDPLALPISSVRSEAMWAVIMYGLWVRRNAGQDFVMSTDTPEALGVLERHLDIASEPSLAVRSVYGSLFPWLDLLDPRWASDNRNRLFPREDELGAMREAAWSSYIVFNRPSSRMLEVLADEYSAAIERVGSTDAIAIRFANPDEHLAQHLMTYYWRGDLSLDTMQGLLARFYGKADDELRAKAMSFVGQSLQSTSGEISPEITARLRALWSARLESIRDHPEAGQRELAAFGWWFVSGKLEDDWSLSQLKEVLRLFTREKLEQDRLVAERLAELCPRYPQQCLELLRLKIDGSLELGRLWRNPARTILSTALTSDDADTRQNAQALVHRLGAKGYLEYRDLLSG